MGGPATADARAAAADEFIFPGYRGATGFRLHACRPTTGRSGATPEDFRRTASEMSVASDFIGAAPASSCG